MNLGIYKCVIIHICVLFYDVNTLLSVEIKENKTGIIGNNETEIECAYIKQQGSRIGSVSFLAFNKTANHFESILYLSETLSFLTLQGQYLKGRASFAKINQTATKAVLIVTNLMCVDNTHYQCQVRAVIPDVGESEITSNTISISVQVPPSKPDDIALIHMPADFPHSSTKLLTHSSSSPSTTVTSLELETVPPSQSAVQNDISTYIYSTPPEADPNTTTTTPSNNNIFLNNSHINTTYFTHQTTSKQGIAVGDNITVVCNGDVGKPPARHIFQKILHRQTVPMQDTVTKTSISEMSKNCSYFRSSNLTFQVTAEDNKAVIRCVVNVSILSDMYIDTEPIEVYSDISTTQSSSTGSSSGVDKKEEKSKQILGLVGIGVAVVTVIVVMIIIIACRRNTPAEPAVYALVNEASKLKNKQKTETPEKPDTQEEDPYAETQEGVYDETGNPRHKENKVAEQFDVSSNSSKQNSNGDNKLSIQTSQGSYSNQGFEKEENRKVATVSPTVRSSSVVLL